MKLINKYIFLSLSLIIINFVTIYTMEKNEDKQANGFKYKTFNEWYKACEELPYFQTVGTNYSNKAVDLDELNTAIAKFVEIHSNGELGNVENWIDDAPEKNSNFFTTKKPLSFPVMPFVQKLVVDPDAEISFHGDFHGDVHSLVKYIQWLNDNQYMDDFKIIKKNFYIVTLGDYVDRGNYGAEVWYTLMRLKIENPDQCIIVRGNHEDSDINQQYGFAKELNAKFPENPGEISEISRVYDLIPVALYLGSRSNDNLVNYLLCIHGGLEFNFNPQKALSADRNLAFQWLKWFEWGEFGFTERIDDIGFLWNNFNVDPDAKTEKNRGNFKYNIYSKDDTIRFLKNISNPEEYIVRAIFRAHQHSLNNDSMMDSIINKGGGISRLWPNETNHDKSVWDDMVATFLVAPDTAYGKGHGYTYDAFGMLKMSDKFEDWKLGTIKNLGVVKA